MYHDDHHDHLRADDDGMAHPDVCANRHGGNAESVDAHASIMQSAETLRLAILDAIREYGPVTCDEIEVALGMRHQTASARCSELLRDGLLVRSGERRVTRSGRNAAVLVVARAEAQAA